MSESQPRKTLAGQSLSEYLLPVGLVCILAISFANMVGGNITDLFGSMITKNSSSRSIPTTTVATGNTRRTSTLGIPTSVANVPPGLQAFKQVSVDMGNGKVLTLNYTMPAETVGGNGNSKVTENALFMLDQIVSQLEEEGLETPENIEMLRKLSELGHDIKGIQQLVQNKMPAEGFQSAEEQWTYLNANTIELNGKSISLLEALKKLNIDGTSSRFKTKTEFLSALANPDLRKPSSMDGSINNLNANNFTNWSISYFTSSEPLKQNAMKQPLTAFMQQLANIRSAGILKNPVLAELVQNQLSRQIFDASNQTIFAPSSAEVQDLANVSKTNANHICTISQYSSCQDLRENP